MPGPRVPLPAQSNPPVRAPRHYSLESLVDRFQRRYDASRASSKGSGDIRFFIDHADGVALSPRNSAALTALGRAYDNHLDDTITHAMTLYQVLLREPELAYGSFGTETTGHSEAIPWFRVAVRNEVNPGEAYLALGTSYEALGRMEDALGADILAAEFRPEMSDTHYRLGLAAVRAGARQRARSANEALREVNSELAEDLLSRIEGR